MKYRAKDQLTTSDTITPEGCISENEWYHYINSCPFFQTYNDGKTGEYETLLYPFFRRFFFELLQDKPMSYNDKVVQLNEYLVNTKNVKSKMVLNKCLKHLSNFYYLFHPCKKYKVILPYFPYKLKFITGCTEAIIQTKSGIRMCNYDFTTDAITGESLNYNGFKLQLAARAFENYSNIKPTSLVCVYTYSKTPVYYSYNSDEKLEDMNLNLNNATRRYGTHCAYCMMRNCTPLIDRFDLYGWKDSDSIWNRKAKLLRMKKYKYYVT